MVENKTKKEPRPKPYRPASRLLLIGLALSALFWVVESAVDAFVFNAGTFVGNLISPPPLELWMRLLIIAMIIGISVYARYYLTVLIRREEELKGSEDRYRNLIETANDAIFTADTETGLIIDANKKAGELLGIPVEKIIGMHQAELHPKEYAERYANVFLDAIDAGGGAIFSEDLYVSHKDGRRIPVEISSSVLESGGRRIIQGIFRDLTERKRIEEELRKHKENLEELVEERTTELMKSKESLGRVTAEFTRTEGEFQKTMEGWEFAFDALPDMITVHDADFNIIGSNRAASKMLGLSVMSPSKAKCFELYHGTDRPPEGCPACEMRETGKPCSFEMYEGRFKKHFEVRVIPRRDDNNELVSIIHIVRDITDRKRAEDELVQSEERFRQMAENIQEVFWIISTGLDEMLYISPAYEKVWGRTCESLYKDPHSWLDAIFPEDRERVSENFSRQGAGHFEEEYRIVRPDGTIRHIRDQAFPVRNEAGEVYRVAGFARDVTERKRAEEALTESEKKYRGLVDNALVGVYKTNLKGEVLYANDAARKIFEYDSVEEMISEGALARYKDPEDRKVFIDALKKSGELDVFESEMVTKTGKIIHILLSATLDGDILSGMVMDVTERKRAEEALRNVSDSVLSVTGESFFRELVLGLAKTLDMDFVFVSELIGEGKGRVRTVAACAEGEIVENFEYDLAGSPCGDAVAKHFCSSPSGVDRDFRHIPMVRDKGIQGHMGTALLDSTGNPMGIICVLSTRAIENVQLAESMLNIFAVRASAEMERKRSEEALRNISDAVSSVTGESFFRELVKSLAGTLNVDTAYVGELSGEGGKVRTTAVSSGGVIVENFEYDLAGTPCEDIEGDSFCCCFPSGVQKLFPGNRFLSESGADGYMGCLLRDSDGKTVGVLVVLSRSPIENQELAESMLKIFAVRASAEMERKRSEEALRNISEAVSSVTGESFFRVLVESLARTLNMDFAFIGELCGDSGEKIRSVAVCCDGGMVDNFEYDLAGTPCDNVVGKKLCYYPRGVQKLFPEDRLLVDMGIDGYMGCPLLDFADRPLGILVVLNRKPIEEGELAESMLKIFAVRASAEIERIRSEGALRLHSRILTDMAEGVHLTRTSDGVIVFTNPKLNEMFGYGEGELVGKHLSVLNKSTDVDPKEMAEWLLESLKKNEAWSGEVHNIRKDGTPFWCYTNISPFEHHEFGKVWISVHTDITERKSAEEALRVSEERLRDAQRMEMIGNLAAGVAHEVRNPLTTIMATTDALLRDFASDAEYRPYLTDMRSQANRLSKLMKDLLEFGKTIEPSCLEPVPLTEVCTSAIELCKQLPFENSFKVRLDHREGPAPVEVLVQGDRLEQVFQNLLENAVHHSADGGEIDMVIEAPQDGMCRVRIVDRGSGIPEDVLAFVFDPFFSTRRGGTGLGLSIVKNIVESFGGSVVLSNNSSGPGCAVEVTLPVAQSEKR